MSRAGDEIACVVWGCDRVGTEHDLHRVRLSPAVVRLCAEHLHLAEDATRRAVTGVTGERGVTG